METDPVQIELEVNQQAFAHRLATELSIGGHTPVELVETILGDELAAAVQQALGPRLIKPPRTVVHDHYFRSRFATLPELATGGYETWYPEVRFSTKAGDEIAEVHVAPRGLDLKPIVYGGGYQETYRYKSKALKTQTNHTLRLHHPVLPGEVFSQAAELLRDLGLPDQPLVANLTVGTEVEGSRVVAFDHVLTGQRFLCSCQREAHEIMTARAEGVASTYAPGSWPHRLVDILGNAEYRDGICHLCLMESGEALDAPYGGAVRTQYGPYVDALAAGQGLDSRTAKAEAKRRLSISRWVREDQVYSIIARLFPGEVIQREASPPWLGRQRLDIYLPRLSLAIEHQGEQHYRAIDLFGGTVGLAKRRQLDKRKRELCSRNDVYVVDVRFDEALTLANLRHRLRLRRWGAGEP